MKNIFFVLFLTLSCLCGIFAVLLTTDIVLTYHLSSFCDFISSTMLMLVLVPGMYFLFTIFLSFHLYSQEKTSKKKANESFDPDVSQEPLLREVEARRKCCFCCFQLKEKPCRLFWLLVGFAIFFVIIVSVILGLLLSVGAYQGTRKGPTVVQGLNDEVTVLFSDEEVLHITASSTEDVFFAQGLLTAELRMWQMEFQRRVGQ